MGSCCSNESVYDATVQLEFSIDPVAPQPLPPPTPPALSQGHNFAQAQSSRGSMYPIQSLPVPMQSPRLLPLFTPHSPRLGGCPLTPVVPSPFPQFEMAGSPFHHRQVCSYTPIPFPPPAAAMEGRSSPGATCSPTHPAYNMSPRMMELELSQYDFPSARSALAGRFSPSHIPPAPSSTFHSLGSGWKMGCDAPLEERFVDYSARSPYPSRCASPGFGPYSTWEEPFRAENYRVCRTLLHAGTRLRSSVLDSGHANPSSARFASPPASSRGSGGFSNPLAFVLPQPQPQPTASSQRSSICVPQISTTHPASGLDPRSAGFVKERAGVVDHACNTEPFEELLVRLGRSPGIQSSTGSSPATVDATTNTESRPTFLRNSSTEKLQPVGFHKSPTPQLTLAGVPHGLVSVATSGGTTMSSGTLERGNTSARPWNRRQSTEGRRTSVIGEQLVGDDIRLPSIEKDSIR